MSAECGVVLFAQDDELFLERALESLDRRDIDVLAIDAGSAAASAVPALRLLRCTEADALRVGVRKLKSQRVLFMTARDVLLERAEAGENADLVVGGVSGRTHRTELRANRARLTNVWASRAWLLRSEPTIRTTRIDRDVRFVSELLEAGATVRTAVGPFVRRGPERRPDANDISDRLTMIAALASGERDGDARALASELADASKLRETLAAPLRTTLEAGIERTLRRAGHIAACATWCTYRLKSRYGEH